MDPIVRPALAALAAALLATPAAALAQRGPVSVSPDSLRATVFAIAADSMGGRETGSPCDAATAQWVAAAFARAGLTPAGENGTWF